MAKRRVPGKVTVEYRSENGRIEYVPRTPAELRPELVRVQDAVRMALRCLARLQRHRHIVIVTARFQLQNCLQSLADDATDELVAAEIARLSVVMEDTVNLLGRLKNSRIPYLEDIRFRLIYGQTPKKREITTSFTGKGKHGRIEDDEQESHEDW